MTVEKKDLVELLKSVLGYKTAVRDTLLTRIVDSVIDELENNKGIKIDLENNEHFMFIVDLSAHRYKNQGGDSLPRNLEYRLRNLIIKYRGKADVG